MDTKSLHTRSLVEELYKRVVRMFYGDHEGMAVAVELLLREHRVGSVTADASTSSLASKLKIMNSDMRKILSGV